MQELEEPPMIFVDILECKKVFYIHILIKNVDYYIILFIILFC